MSLGETFLVGRERHESGGATAQRLERRRTMGNEVASAKRALGEASRTAGALQARSATSHGARRASKCPGRALRRAAGAGREGCRDASSDREGPVVPRHGVRTALRRPRVTDSETQRALWECGDSEQRRRRRRRTAVHGGTGPRWARRAQPLVEMLSFVKESQNSGFSREIA